MQWLFPAKVRQSAVKQCLKQQLGNALNTPKPTVLGGKHGSHQTLIVGWHDHARVGLCSHDLLSFLDGNKARPAEDTPATQQRGHRRWDPIPDDGSWKKLAFNGSSEEEVNRIVAQLKQRQEMVACCGVQLMYHLVASESAPRVSEEPTFLAHPREMLLHRGPSDRALFRGTKPVSTADPKAVAALQHAVFPAFPYVHHGWHQWAPVGDARVPLSAHDSMPLSRALTLQDLRLLCGSDMQRLCQVRFGWTVWRQSSTVLLAKGIPTSRSPSAGWGVAMLLLAGMLYLHLWYGAKPSAMAALVTELLGIKRGHFLADKMPLPEKPEHYIEGTTLEKNMRQAMERPGVHCFAVPHDQGKTTIATKLCHDLAAEGHIVWYIVACSHVANALNYDLDNATDTPLYFLLEPFLRELKRKQAAQSLVIVLDQVDDNGEPLASEDAAAYVALANLSALHKNLSTIVLAQRTSTAERIAVMDPCRLKIDATRHQPSELELEVKKLAKLVSDMRKGHGVTAEEEKLLLQFPFAITATKIANGYDSATISDIGRRVSYPFFGSEYLRA